MSEEERKGANVVDILVGMFVVLFGLCLLLAGGGCTILWVSWVIPGGAAGGGGALGILMLIVSLGAVALGLYCLYDGTRILRSRHRDGAAGPPTREP